MDLDELFSAIKQQKPDDGIAKAWEEFAYPWDCNCITTSTIGMNEFAYGPKHYSPLLK